jgi:hypothetical protein
VETVDGPEVVERRNWSYRESMKRLVLLAMVLTWVGSGAMAAEQSGDEAPRLYTNADLDRLGPGPAEPSRPISGADDPGWDYVQQFLDREHARLEADRLMDLEESRRAAENDALYELARERDYSVPYYGGYWYNPWVGVPGHHVGRGTGRNATNPGARPGVRPGDGRPAARPVGARQGNPRGARRASVRAAPRTSR